MKTKPFFLAVGALLLGLVAQAAEAPKFTTFTLDNGLTVILNEDHEQTEVFGLIAVRAGHKNNPADATGVAHYFEHIMFKGTQNVGTLDYAKEKEFLDQIENLYQQLGQTTDKKQREQIQKDINAASIKSAQYSIPNEYQNVLSQMGATHLNAGTSYDYTIYHSQIPANQLERWLVLEKDRFENPVFRGFQSELEVVYEEKNWNNDKEGYAFFTKLLESIFKTHPYRNDGLGTLEHLKNPSLQRMAEFYKTYYVPGNMALILTGNLNVEAVKPLINNTLGQLPAQQAPAVKFEKEAPFKGRELVEVRLTPYDEMAMAYRTVTAEHPDHAALAVCLRVLNNSNGIGMLDQLRINNKVFVAVSEWIDFVDESAAIFVVVPKLDPEFFDDPVFIAQMERATTEAEMRNLQTRFVAQARKEALKNAEAMVKSEFTDLQNGDFDEILITAAKYELEQGYKRMLETLEGRANIAADAFVGRRTMEEQLGYVEKIKSVTKQDIMRVAKQYFGENYLALWSRTGSPKKEKVDKPKIDPVVAVNRDVHSDFAKKLFDIPATETGVHKYIDFDKDVTFTKLSNGNGFYHTPNPYNNIFSLTLRFDVGTKTKKDLRHIDLMNYAGIRVVGVADYKRNFSKFGCSYSIYADKSYTYIEFSGIEENFKQAAGLINEMITAPVLAQDRVKLAIEGAKFQRLSEKENADVLFNALTEYLQHGKESEYIDRLSVEETEKLQAISINGAFVNACAHSATIFYTGSKSNADAIAAFEDAIKLSQNPIKGNAPMNENYVPVNENKIYVLNNKSSLQSKIGIYTLGENFDVQKIAPRRAFNAYLSGGFSGLMIQEIREYRSLAYTAYASWDAPLLLNTPLIFNGYIGSQSDKTGEAVNTFFDLARNLPEKDNSITWIKPLMLSANAQRPHFRGLAQTIDTYKRWGLTQDPAIALDEAYKNLTFADIKTFYENNLKNANIAIGIVGDKGKMNLKPLEKYGKVKSLSSSDIMSK